MANMDNGTMVEAFKHLNYCQLAKNSLVSKRFRNVIETHRHKLAILCVHIRMQRDWDLDVEPAFIKLFNKEISSEEYNEWVVRNNYSKQISPTCQAAGDSQDYALTAYGDYKDPNQGRKSVLFARAKLNHETWPLLQHFVRLITDPFIHIRSLRLIPQADVLKLLAATIDRSNRGRLQCETLNFNFEGDVQESFSYIKDHVRCANFQMAGWIRSGPDYDKELLDFFSTGSHCTSDTFVIFDDISKAVIVDFVQKFVDRKNNDESQMIELIRGYVSITTAKELTTNYDKFFIKEEDFGYGWTAHVFEFVNADIGKKMRLIVSDPASSQVTLKILNL